MSKYNHLWVTLIVQKIRACKPAPRRRRSGLRTPSRLRARRKWEWWASRSSGRSAGPSLRSTAGTTRASARSPSPPSLRHSRCRQKTYDKDLWQSLRRSAQRKFGKSEFMRMTSGKFQTPAGVYKASRRTQSVRERNFWPSATDFKPSCTPPSTSVISKVTDSLTIFNSLVSWIFLILW